MTAASTSARLFTEYRPLLFSISYEILGSASDADDVLQESYLRWSGVPEDSVDDPRAYLARVVTRQSLNHLRAASRRREDYVGNWLPEPIRTSPDSADDIVLAESVSMAMMLVLQSLGPEERAVFVLREVFGFSHREIAGAVERPEATVRQIAHRARAHVQARRKRFDPPRADVYEVTERFLGAALGGDIQELMDLLAPDVVEISDGGGVVSAARRPIVGARAVANFMVGLARIGLPDQRIETGLFNSLPAVLVYSGAGLDMVGMIEVSGGLVTGVYLVRNPGKLGAVDGMRVLTR